MLKDLLNAEIEKTERRLDVMNEYPQGYALDIVELSGYLDGLRKALAYVAFVRQRQIVDDFFTHGPDMSLCCKTSHDDIYKWQSADEKLKALNDDSSNA